jgi:hypothetical protein
VFLEIFQQKLSTHQTSLTKVINSYDSHALRKFRVYLFTRKYRCIKWEARNSRSLSLPATEEWFWRADSTSKIWTIHRGTHQRRLKAEQTNTKLIPLVSKMRISFCKQAIHKFQFGEYCNRSWVLQYESFAEQEMDRVWGD